MPAHDFATMGGCLPDKLLSSCLSGSRPGQGILVRRSGIRRGLVDGRSV